MNANILSDVPFMGYDGRTSARGARVSLFLLSIIIYIIVRVWLNIVHAYIRVGFIQVIKGRPSVINSQRFKPFLQPSNPFFQLKLN